MKKRSYYLPIGTVLSFAVLLPIFFPEFMNQSGPVSLDEIMDFTAMENIALMISVIRMAVLTAAIVASIRLAIACFAGALAGYGSWSAGKLIGLFESSIGILPPIMLGLAIIAGIFASGSLDMDNFWAFVALLSLLGWSWPAKRISSGIKTLQMDRVSKGRQAAGGGAMAVALGNVSRFLKENLAEMFFEQMVRVLTFLAQLCVFYSLLQGLGAGGEGVAQFLPNWQDEPLFAACLAGAFFIGIFGFGLMAEGLKRRRARGLESKGGYVRFPATAAAVCAACVLAVMFAYLNVPVSGFNMVEMRRTLDFERTGELIPGSPESRQRADLIASELEEMGYVATSDSFVQFYERSETIVPVYDELVLDLGDERISYTPGVDYFADTFGLFDVSGNVFDMRKSDYYSLDEMRGDFLGNWILLERRGYSEEDIMKFAEKFLLEYHAKGILLVDDGNERRYAAQGKGLSRKPILSVGMELADDLAGMGGDLSYRQIPKSNDGQGVYVLAEMKGQRAEKPEKIVIGLSYGWQYEPIKSGKIEFGLELASRLADMRNGMKKTIILAFFDSDGGAVREARDGFAGSMPFDGDDISLFIDLTRIDGDASGIMAYRTEAGNAELGYAAIIERTIRSGVYKNGNSLECRQIKGAYEGPFYGEGQADRAYIAFEPCEGSSMDIEDFGGFVVEAIARLGR